MSVLPNGALVRSVSFRTPCGHGRFLRLRYLNTRLRVSFLTLDRPRLFKWQIESVRSHVFSPRGLHETTTVHCIARGRGGMAGRRHRTAEQKETADRFGH